MATTGGTDREPRREVDQVWTAAEETTTVDFAGVWPRRATRHTGQHQLSPSMEYVATTGSGSGIGSGVRTWRRRNHRSTHRTPHHRYADVEEACEPWPVGPNYDNDGCSASNTLSSDRGERRRVRRCVSRCSRVGVLGNINVISSSITGTYRQRICRGIEHLVQQHYTQVGT